MDPAEKTQLSALLAAQRPGTWVVLDAGMSKILSAANTPEEAIEKAHIPPSVSEHVVGERPVMLQVPERAMVCLL